MQNNPIVSYYHHARRKVRNAKPSEAASLGEKFKMTTILNSPVWKKAANGGERSVATLTGVGPMRAGRRQTEVQIGVTATGYRIAWRWGDNTPWVSVDGAAASIDDAKARVASEGFARIADAINNATRDGNKITPLKSVAW